MKTKIHYFEIKPQKLLVTFVILVTLLGLGVRTYAQNPEIGSDESKIRTSMKIQLHHFDFDVVIPKINAADLNAFTDVKFNHLVYVTDKNPGFYKFFNNEWAKKSVKEVLEIIEMNLSISNPRIEDVILTVNNRNLLDYNGHVNHLYSNFAFEKGGQLAIHISK